MIVPRMNNTAPQNGTGMNTKINNRDRMNHRTVAIMTNNNRLERIFLILCRIRVNLAVSDH